MFLSSHIDSHLASSSTYDLGEHTLIIASDGTIEIADQGTATQLTPDEVYKLLTVLLTLFPS